MSDFKPLAAVDTFDANVKYPRAQGYNIKVGKSWFRTVAGPETQIQLGTRDSLAERMDRAGSIYETVLDIGYAWARTDLSGGEGLDWDPRQLALDQDQAALDQTRYWDSSGVDVRRPDTAGVPYSLRLSRAMAVWKGDPAHPLTNPIDFGTSETHIYIADGESIYRYNGWTDISADVLTPAAGLQIRAIAVAPNDTVLAVVDGGDAYIKTPLTDLFEKAYTDNGNDKLEAQGCWYVNGRFLLSTFDNIDTAQLFAIEWDSTDWEPEGAIDTASSPFWSVVESGPAIVAACGDGTVRSYAPAGQGDMSLIPWGRITMPQGETPFLLGSNANALLIMTSSNRPELDKEELRVYQAEVLDDRYNYTVGLLQLRREWLATEHEPIVTRNMANSRDEIFWFVKELIKNGYKDSNGDWQPIFLESLWRYDVVTNGLSRVYTVDVIENKTLPSGAPVQGEQIDLNAIVVYDDVHAGIDYNNNVILLADTDTFQKTGYMIFPNITFGLNTDITWLETVIEARGLGDLGSGVELWRSEDPAAILDWDHPSWTLVQRLSSDAASSKIYQLTNVKSRTMSLQLRVFATADALESPHVTRLAIRGIPSHRDFIMLVPFNVSDYVSVPNRKPLRYPGLGESLHSQVLSLVGNSVEVTMLRPNVLFRGIVNNVSAPVELVSNRGSVTRYAIVEFRGQRLVATPQPTGDSGVGLGLLGMAIVGVGQTGLEEE